MHIQIRTSAPAPGPAPRPQLSQLPNQRPPQNIAIAGQPTLNQNQNSAVIPAVNNFQPLVGGQSQNIIRQPPPPLRRIDSRQTIPGQLPLRPQGNINQQYNPQPFTRPPQQQQQLQQSQPPQQLQSQPLQQLQSQQSQQQYQQQRPLNPNQNPNTYGQPRGPPNQQQYQANRPQFYPPNIQQPQNLQNRPPVRLLGGPGINQINPNTPTSQVQFRPQFAPQPRPIQPIRQIFQPQPPQHQAIRSQNSLERIRSQQEIIPIGMTSEIQKVKPDSPTQSSVTTEDDDDVIIRRAVTPGKTIDEEIKSKPETPTNIEEQPKPISIESLPAKINDAPVHHEVKRVEFNMSPQSNEIDTNKQQFEPLTDRRKVITPIAVTNGNVDNSYRQITDRQKTPSPDTLTSNLNLNSDQQKDASVLKANAIAINAATISNTEQHNKNVIVKSNPLSSISNNNSRPQSETVKENTNLPDLSVKSPSIQSISLKSIINPEKSAGLVNQKSTELKSATSLKDKEGGKITKSRLDTKTEAKQLNQTTTYKNSKNFTFKILNRLSFYLTVCNI